ncbi:beta-1,6-N-acetylglucosaminyltransferase [Nostoc sp. MS1]|uniref:beta-1,6-N-acetylglucosaminyltransferase n=1 Tax=Nostoc sp. MS1 TaxID=2764711 RepID=UPI001CC78991|nr:beta-1,6-N-acetylglucosaminyltransferase [Nostoc sp. MS1]BCL36772.1 hypothetical protein NSMS1_32190 [Nostoc sp. MS1]
MNLAYLILAHNNPSHLQKLIKALDGADTHFFIHIDAKQDISPFQSKISNENISFIKERSIIFWGEFSIVQATIDLIKAALSKQKFEYLILISGSDYPLKNAQYIKDFLQRKKGSEFITLVEVPHEEYRKGWDRFHQYRISFPSNNKILRGVKRVLNFVINNVLHWQRNYKKSLGDLKPYAGGQWWALSGDACQYILDFIEKNPKVVRFFQTAFIPDESFFQTILGNSSFMSRIKPNLTFTKWDDSEHPNYITVELLQSFKFEDVINRQSISGCSEVLFARKFAPDSEEVIKFIENHIA